MEALWTQLLAFVNSPLGQAVLGVVGTIILHRLGIPVPGLTPRPGPTPPQPVPSPITPDPLIPLAPAGDSILAKWLKRQHGPAAPPVSAIDPAWLEKLRAEINTILVPQRPVNTISTEDVR